MIYIDWDAIMTDTMLNNTVYWVSAGAEYSNDDELWVGSASFMSLLDEYNEVGRCVCLLSQSLNTFS